MKIVNKGLKKFSDLSPKDTFKFPDCEDIYFVTEDMTAVNLFTGTVWNAVSGENRVIKVKVTMKYMG